MEAQIRALGLVVTLAVVLYGLGRGKELPALIFVALAPLSYFARNLFVVLTPAKLMGLVFLALLLLRPRYREVIRRSQLRYFVPYYVYSVVVTVMLSPLWPEYVVTEQGFFYGNAMRGYVQILQVAMGLGIVACLVESLKSHRSLLKAQSVLLSTMAAVCVYGLYVWVAQRTGLPFNPINRQGRGGELGREIHAAVDGIRMTRAYSLTGEPKQLAANASLGLVLAYFTPASAFGFWPGVKSSWFLGLLFLGTLVLTLSTAGYVMLPIMVAVAAVVTLRVRQLGAESGRRILAILLTVALGSVVLENGIVHNVTVILESRFGARLGEEGLLSYAEDAIVRFWGDQPHFAVTGVGMGGAAFYVREYDTFNYAGYIAAPRGIVGFVADKGLVGLALFAYALVKAARPVLWMAVYGGPTRRIYGGSLVVVAVCVVMMFSAGQWHDEWLAVGLLCAAARSASLERRERKLLGGRSSAVSRLPLPRGLLRLRAETSR